MLFNRGFFNEGTFNRSGDSASAEFFGNISWNLAGAAAQGLKTVAPLRGTAALSFNSSARIGRYVQLPQTQAAWGWGASGTIGIILNLQCTSGITFDMSGGLGTISIEELFLTGLNLHPGETVTIDTDFLNILVNGAPRVDVWRRGSEWIKLMPGQNELQFMNDSGSSMSVEVEWHDRWW